MWSPESRAVELFLEWRILPAKEVLRSLQDRPEVALSSLFPSPVPVSRLLCPVAADRHAAPAPRMSQSVIGKHQSAGRSLARFYVREILLANQLRQNFRDGFRERISAHDAGGALADPMLDVAHDDFFVDVVEKIVEVSHVTSTSPAQPGR